MSTERWRSVIAAACSLGIKNVQFIGGEPTAHQDFQELLYHASISGMAIEVYSNLTNIRPKVWELFRDLRVDI
jgi:MoaA/NifB/PqqE/SkfB family radical SAM enzyme